MLSKRRSNGFYDPAGALFVAATFTCSDGRFRWKARCKSKGHMDQSLQFLSLFIIAVPVASIAWTVTAE
jgi:hypothetical protein